ncbi:hypothetical protein, partial [Nocardioides sp.]|uniref:hypothetical protein n=1 Tax=Nocardioides sp. TaxID=35761 RepID=UPI002732EB64
MTETQRSQAMRTRSLPGAWRSGAGALALAVILVQLLWRGSVMMRGYFTQDDFLILSSGVSREPDLVPWLQPFAGGLSPLGHALAGVQTAARPLDWFVVGAVAIVVQTATAVLLWLVLCRLLGESWLRVVLLGVACLSPLTIWATASWAAAVTTLPPALLLVAAAWFMLLRLEDG